MTILYRTIFIILLILGAQYLTPALYSQCFVSDITIVPAVTVAEREFLIQVNGLSPSDLSSDQALCRIDMEFDHGRISNVRMKLKSPAGQEITLIGPGITGGNISPIVKWNIMLLPCAQPVLPDTGFDPIWDSGQNWATLTTYTGSYYPHSGCLEDFNMGSAEGDWILTLENLGNITGTLTYFALTFCNGQPDDCVGCGPYAGELNVQTLEYCEGVGPSTPLQQVVLPDLTASDTLIYFIADALGAGNFVADLDELPSLAAGSHTACPVVVSQLDLNNLVSTISDFPALEALVADATSCMDLGTCVAIEVYPFQNTVEENFLICAGDTLDYEGEQYTSAIDTFLYDGSPTLPCAERTHLVVTVEELQLDLDVASTVLVCGQQAFLDAGASSASPNPITQYAWSTSDGNYTLDVGPIAQVDQAGTYILEVGTDNNCVALDSVIITSEDTFFIQLEQELIACTEDELVITVVDSIPPGGAPTAFTISNVIGPDPDPLVSSNEVVVTTPGLYFITTTAGSCTVSSEILVTPSTVPDYLLEITADTLNCSTTTATLQWTTDIPNANPTFKGAQPILQGTVDPQVSIPGWYYIIVEDDNNCEFTDSVEVILDEEAPVLAMMDQSFSCVMPFEDRILSSGPIDEVVSYSWTGPMFSSIEAQPSVSLPGEYVLVVTASNGCTAEGLSTIEIISTDIDFEVDSLLLPCFMDSIEICASAFPSTIINPVWSELTQAGTITLSMDSCFFLTRAGNYNFAAETPEGCTMGNDFQAFEERFSYNVDLSADPSIGDCSASPSTLSADPISTGPFTTVTWSLDGVVLPQYTDFLEIEVLEDGLYEVLVEFDNTACTATNSVTVSSVLNNIQVSIGPDVTINSGETLTLNAQLDPPLTTQTLDWQPTDLLSCTDCVDPSLAPAVDTEIILTVTDSLGCSASDTLLVTVLDTMPGTGTGTEPIIGDSLIYFPTIFQSGLPGNDQLIIGIDVTEVSQVEMSVYDRWGNLMAEVSESITSDQLLIWDGRRDGQPAEQGIYVYMAKYLQLNGLEKVSVGTFTLIR